MYINIMKHAEQLKKIQESTLRKNILWSDHASKMMIERQISSTGVMHVILSGEIIKEYETSIIIFGWFENKPLHIICFYQKYEDCVFITTVYQPDKEHFESDFKTRRKR
jgi:hypothetical protein